MIREQYFLCIGIFMMLLSCGGNDDMLEKQNEEVSKYTIEKTNDLVVISYNKPIFHSDSSIVMLLFGKKDSLGSLNNEVSYPSFIMFDNRISLKTSLYDSIVKKEGYIPFIEEYLFDSIINKDDYNEKSTFSDVLDYKSDKIKGSTFVLIE